MIPQLLVGPARALLTALLAGAGLASATSAAAAVAAGTTDPNGTNGTGDEENEILSQTVSLLAVVLGLVVAFVLALVIAAVIGAAVRAAGRRTPIAQHLTRRSRRPLRVALTILLSWIAIRVVLPEADAAPWWRPGLEHLFLIALIIAAAWLVASLAFVMEDSAVTRYRIDVPDNRHARRVRTQMMLLRRLTVVVVAVVALAAVLLTFEGARAAGAGLLASAGLLSVVAGLAAQTSLANVFAGLQLAFTDAIRVDDVVVVEEEWGRIEEITMTYVVVHLWDDRRLILPSTYFTQTPFQNWTRRQADLLGTVEIDLDWRVPVDEMRAELARLLHASPLWDQRVGVLQVTEATGGLVRVRALASAPDAPSLFDLRCRLREGLVDWLQREHPEALPHSRWETASPGTGARPAVADDVPPADATLPEQVERVGRGPQDERAEAAAEATAEASSAQAAADGTPAGPGGEPAASDEEPAASAEEPPADRPTQHDTIVLRLDDADRREGPARSRRSLRSRDVVPVDEVGTVGSTAENSTAENASDGTASNRPGASTQGVSTQGSAETSPENAVGPETLGSGTVATASGGSEELRRVHRRPVADRQPDRQVDVREVHDTDSHATLFTGSSWAVQRSRSFAGPGEEVIAEREQNAQERERRAAEELRREDRRRASLEETSVDQKRPDVVEQRED